jgi:glycosyltransferase involved in cell wall biosynthesis
MRITFLCQYFPPEMGAPAARTYEHARHWVELGHEVTVITGFPNHPTGILHPEYRGVFTRREQVDGIDLRRTWVYCAPNKGFLKRVLNFLSFFFSSLILGGLLTSRPQMVIGTSPQFFCAVAAWLLSRLKRVPFVFEVRDIWPQSAIELGALRNPLAIRILESLEQHLYRAASLIVIVAESTRPYLHARGISDAKIALIPNGIDLRFLESSGDSTESFREREGWSDKFLVSYIGTHGMSHALEVVLSAAARLSSDPSIHFLFVGEGAEKARLVRMAQEANLSNVTFLNEQPRPTLPAIYGASNVSLVPLRRLQIFTKVLPSKLFELMGVGCPIICSVEGEAAQLVERSGAGICIEPENVEALVETIIKLRNDPAQCAAMRKAGQVFARTHYSRTVLAEKYLEALCGHI